MTREEAIEIVKTQYSHDAVMTTALGMLIPELQESDDERIRKALINGMKYLRNRRKTLFYDLPINDVIAWLEKQKEQKSAEWSEEDRNRLDEAIEMIEANGTWVRSGDGVKQVSDFLKALPERFNLQPKQEWSEEDEKIIRFYEADYNNQIGDMSMKDVIDMRLQFKNWLVNRLKSLRPKPQEQPDVDLENQIQLYIESIGFGHGGWVDGLSDEDLRKIARHFFNLGLNARKV